MTGRHRGHQAVPMVGHHDHHGVDVVAAQHVAEILVRIATLVLARGALGRIVGVDLLLAGLAPAELFGQVAVAPGVHVAHGNHLHVVQRQEGGQIDRALVAQADECDVDPVARGPGAQDRRGHHRRNRHGRRRHGRGAEELTPSDGRYVFVVGVHERAPGETAGKPAR